MTNPTQSDTVVTRFLVTVTNDGDEAAWFAEDVQTILREGETQPYIEGLRVEVQEAPDA